jgi:hypothetical protein
MIQGVSRRLLPPIFSQVLARYDFLCDNCDARACSTGMDKSEVNENSALSGGLSGGGVPGNLINQRQGPQGEKHYES